MQGIVAAISPRCNDSCGAQTRVCATHGRGRLSAFGLLLPYPQHATVKECQLQTHAVQQSACIGCKCAWFVRLGFQGAIIRMFRAFEWHCQDQSVSTDYLKARCVDSSEPGDGSMTEPIRSRQGPATVRG